ncbi:MAG: acyltransferase [Lentimicrobiaceae bacterium]|nr:acyltransferase [Lentimicrobiaceae bacterium]
MKNRVQSLDYLRGLAAFSIMVYHYFTWSSYKLGADTFAGRTGIYGVSVFYVLSGLTLFIVYNNSLSPQNTGHYFVKRIFRIFPLLWLSIFVSVVLLNFKTNLSDLLLNLTGLFGFFAPDHYIAVASWSIGNELVFYTIFPLVIFSGRKTQFAPVLFFALAAGLALFFAYSVLATNLTLKMQWSHYLNPLNQLVLFSGGLLCGQLLAGKKVPLPYALLLLASALLLFVFYPVKGDLSALIAGNNRIIFVLLSLGITASFLMIDFKTGKIAGYVLSTLGEASYSVYLLHPLVFLMLKKYAGFSNHKTLIYTGFAITLLLSILVYHFYEKPFIRLGQRLIDHWKQKQSYAMRLQK